MVKKTIQVKLEEGDEVIEREVKKFGNGSHIILPQKHGEGKKAIIILTKSKKEVKNGN